MRCRTSIFLVSVFIAASAIAADSASLSISKDGAYVEDPQSKLVWSRCVEGTAWDGASCTGQASFVTYAEAHALASARSKSDGVRWRVPSVAELKQLSRRIATARSGRPPFPASPHGWYWTSSTRVDTGTANQYNYKNIERGINEQNVNRVAYLHAWAFDVDASDGRGDMPRRSKLPVRLVRNATESGSAD